MKTNKIPLSEIQKLKTKRDELFREFEDHPWRLSLATEIKNIDDQIAEQSGGKNNAGIKLTK